MEPSISRRLWTLFEAYHAVVYFAPEKKGIYEKAGLKGGWMGYFASRAAAMGPVPAEVVIATFYNFHPEMVRRAIPDAWRFSSPEIVINARLKVADAALRRLLGPEAHSPELQEAAELAHRAALSCRPQGRPLHAAHSALPWPSEAHLVLWHACTLLREHRGDGHVASLVAHGIDGCEAHVLVAAAGVTPADMLREFRWWSEEDWREAEDRLKRRGLLNNNGSLTDAGAETRAAIENTTDELALAPWTALGAADTERLIGLMEPLVVLINSGKGLVYPNPIGLAAPT